MAMVNITSWGTLKEKIEGKALRRHHILCVQEHRLVDRHTRSAKTTIQEAKLMLSKWGWMSHFEPAHITDTGHTSGGVAIIWRPWVAAVGVTSILAHRAVALDVQHAGAIIRLISYFGPADGSFNEKVLFLQKFVGMPQIACIASVLVAGDFNLEAKDVASIVADTRFMVGATSEPTCCSSPEGSCIDFLLTSRRIR